MRILGSNCPGGEEATQDAEFFLGGSCGHNYQTDNVALPGTSQSFWVLSRETNSWNKEEHRHGSPLGAEVQNFSRFPRQACLGEMGKGNTFQIK